jgi:hypothetical protein
LHYRTHDGGPKIVVRARCMAAEDSAAHLRLVEYGDGRAVYSCSRNGY